MPLHITLLIIQRPRPNLKQPHAHPGPHLRQLNSLVPRLDKNMVSDFDRVFDVLEPILSISFCPVHKAQGRDLRDNSIPYFRRAFSRWEQVLEDLNDALAELCAEAFEDEVWVGF